MPSPREITIEACVNSVTSALAAEAGGARRVELCDNLHDGGTTPGPGSIVAARRHLDIALNVIIRPRGGDFLYTDLEFEIMKTEVVRCRDEGVDGVVFGLLGADGTVDRDRTAELVDLAHPLSTTFHRAFDMARDPRRTLEDLIDLGLDRVLTSGQRPSALAGAELLAELVQIAGDRIVVMPGVGIDAQNVAEIVRRTRASEFHVLAESTVPSRMEYRNEAVFMGRDPELDEFAIRQTDAELIRRIVENARTGV
jgi:copper homeostasis protein